MASLCINMLGEFSISHGSKTISDQLNRHKRSWAFLAYLITFRDRDVSQSEMIEALWQEDETENPANTLKTLLHRVRSLIELLDVGDPKQIITYKQGIYGWHPPDGCVVDAEQFDALCQRAFAPDTAEAEKSALLSEATALYKGDFLPKNSTDLWAVPISTYYHGRFVKAAAAAAELLWQAGEYEALVALCQRAAGIDAYDEAIHLYLIRALVALGRQQQALSHYEYVKDLFFTRFGVTPSREMTAIYKEVVKTSKQTELDLGIIKSDLREAGQASGCFFCEFEFFKSLYQLEARAAARTGQSIYVCLLTLTGSAGGKPEQRTLNTSMDRLYETIRTSLRRGDVFSRYSVNQYLVMLPTTSFENGEKVMQRIVRAFWKGKLRSGVALHYSLQPLDPNGF